MAKNVNILLSLRDQFSSPIQKATKSTTNMNKQIWVAKKKMEAFGRSAKKAFKTTAKYAAIGLGAATTAATLFAKSSIEAAKVQIEQETKLAAVLKSTKGIRDSDIESIKKYSSVLETQGVVGDEVNLAGVQQLGTYQLQAETLKKLMPGMNDLLVQTKGLNASTGDAVNVGNMLGKVMTGQVGALSRVGINFTKAQEKVLKFGTEEQKAAILAQVLKQNVGGVNKAMAETDQGKIQQMTNAWGSLKEEVGKKLLPKLANLSAWFFTKIPDIQNLILGTVDYISNLVTQAQPYILQLKELLGKMFENVKPALMEFKNIALIVGQKIFEVVSFMAQNWDRLSPIIYTVVGAYAAWNLGLAYNVVKLLAINKAMKIKATWDTIVAIATGKLAIKQWYLNSAMAANPIGAIITGLVILGGVIYACYKNWDLIKKKTLEFWNSLDNNPITKVIKKIFLLINPVSQAIRLFKALKWIFTNAFNIGAEIFDGIKNAFNSFLKFITEMTDKILEPIKSIKDGIGDGINKVKSFFGFGGETSETKKTKPVKYPRHALGTSYFKGGITGINEGGRNETAILPAGTKILSHEQSKVNSKKESKKVEVHVHIAGNFIGEKEHMERYAEYTGNKIIATLGNI